MKARVVEWKSEVSVDAYHWPFVLDARQGAASIDFAESRFTLRSQSWQDKRKLARFAHLGERYLEEYFLRSCVVDGGPLPSDGPEREALLALARWLNAPGGKDGLPLNQQLLAGVTLQVCRAIQTIPQTFDALDAVDVELLWQAARMEPPPRAAEEQPSGAANRIVIVPDAEPSAIPNESALRAESESPARRGNSRDVRSPVEQVRTEVEAKTVGGTPLERAGVHTPVASPAEETQRGAPSVLPVPGRFRVQLGAQPELPIDRTQCRTQIEPARRDDARAVATGSSAFSASSLLARPVIPDAPAASPSRAPELLSWRLGPDAAFAPEREPDFPATAPVSDARETFFDELAARLEDAAAEQGIDVEP